MLSADTTTHASSNSMRDACRAYALAGALVQVNFSQPMTDEQKEWLCTTSVPLRRIEFHPDDAESHVIASDHVRVIPRVTQFTMARNLLQTGPDTAQPWRASASYEPC